LDLPLARGPRNRLHASGPRPEYVQAGEDVGGEVLRDHENIYITPLVEVATGNRSEDNSRPDPQPVSQLSHVGSSRAQ
jgi:hypothetical protein